MKFGDFLDLILDLIPLSLLIFLIYLLLKAYNL